MNVHGLSFRFFPSRRSFQPQQGPKRAAALRHTDAMPVCVHVTAPSATRCRPHHVREGNGLVLLVQKQKLLPRNVKEEHRNHPLRAPREPDAPRKPARRRRRRGWAADGAGVPRSCEEAFALEGRQQVAQPAV